MFKDTHAQSLQGGGKSIRLSTEPDSCPICHRSVHPKLIVSTFYGDTDSLVQVIYQCTSLKCQEYFIASYTNSNAAMYSLTKTAPVTARKHNFPQVVQDISPTFVEIYNQAIEAESANLTEIIGIGLRKALEFLVKDFAISQNLDKEDKIKNLPLGQCIDKYLSDPNLKKCAKRAVWLGNDETHYIRKWEEKDIEDLKILVKLTVNWAENVLLTVQYEEEMDS